MTSSSSSSLFFLTSPQYRAIYSSYSWISSLLNSILFSSYSRMTMSVISLSLISRSRSLWSRNPRDLTIFVISLFSWWSPSSWFQHPQDLKNSRFRNSHELIFSWYHHHSSWSHLLTFLIISPSSRSHHPHDLTILTISPSTQSQHTHWSRLPRSHHSYDLTHLTSSQ